MIAHSPLTTEHLTRVAKATQSITNLPAIATQDWCEQAAHALVGLKMRTVISVTLGEFGANGQIGTLEASGAASGDNEFPANRLEPVHTGEGGSLGWWPEQHLTNGWCRLLDANPNSTGTARFTPSRRWAQFGVTSSMLAAVHPIGRAAMPSMQRCLVIEIGATDDPTTALSSADVSTLSAALVPLASRALLAFGQAGSDPVNRITKREQAILEQLTLGKTVKQIAEQLNRSPHTVHDHVKSLHRKLNASSRGELIARTLGHIQSCKPAAAPAKVSTPAPTPTVEARYARPAVRQPSQVPANF